MMRWRFPSENHQMGGPHINRTDIDSRCGDLLIFCTCGRGAPRITEPSQRSLEWSPGWWSFFEITRAKPPRYFVEIRHENGDIWVKGWVSEQGQQLRNSDFWGYDGGTVVYLRNEKQLQLENYDGTPIDME